MICCTCVGAGSAMLKVRMIFCIKNDDFFIKMIIFVFKAKSGKGKRGGKGDFVYKIQLCIIK